MTGHPISIILIFFGVSILSYAGFIRVIGFLRYGASFFGDTGIKMGFVGIIFLGAGVLLEEFILKDFGGKITLPFQEKPE